MPMNTQKNEVHITEVPPFVTSDEINQLNTFRAELKRIRSFIFDLCLPRLEARTEIARTAFVGNPSTSNFEALKAAHITQGLIDRQIVSTNFLGQLEAVAVTCEKAARDFTRPILSRALDKARKRYEQLAEDERLRHKKIVGKNLPEPSPLRPDQNVGVGARPVDWRNNNPILVAARQPIDRLERLLGSADQIDVILKFLGEHAL
jgi:hypothetical protein